MKKNLQEIETLPKPQNYKQLIYEMRFDELINTINEKYPSFFAKNENLLYIIMKFNFIKLIIFQHDIESAKIFYNQYLLSIMGKVYGKNSTLYNRKHYKYKHFLLIISQNNKFTQFQEFFYLQPYFDKFLNLLEKTFEKENKPDRNNILFNVVKYSDNKNLNDFKPNFNSGNQPLFKTERVNNLNYSSENMSEIEEELFNLNINLDNKKNLFTVYSVNNQNIISNISQSESVIDIDNSSNIIKKINTKKFIENNNFISSSEENKEKKNINKFRRVNLCKKIVRKFKKFLKNKKDIISPFWSKFAKENLLPPFKHEEIEFKSFSHTFLHWLFSHQGGVDLYNEFINFKGEEELDNIYSCYCIRNLEEKKNTEKFFKNFAVYFSAIKNNSNENISDCAINNGGENKNEGSDYNCMKEQEKNDAFKLEIYRNCREFEIFEKIVKSDSSNSSMDNALLDINNENEIGNIHENIDNFTNNNNTNNNYHIDDFAIIPDEKIFKNNNLDISPDIHFNEIDKNHFYNFNYMNEFNNNSANVNTNKSSADCFFNNEENIYDKKFDNSDFNED